MKYINKSIINDNKYIKIIIIPVENNEKIKQVCGDEDLKEMLNETEKVLMEKQE